MKTCDAKAVSKRFKITLNRNNKRNHRQTKSCGESKLKTDSNVSGLKLRTRPGLIGLFDYLQARNTKLKLSVQLTLAYAS